MNYIQQLWQRIIESDNQPLLDKIYALQQTIEAEKQHNQELNSLLSNTKQKYNELEAENLLLEADNSLLTKQIEELMIKQQSKDKELEDYWNNKIKPTTSIKYSARDGKPMNIIDFFNKNNDKVPTMTGSSGDVLANNILKYVQKNVKYTKDIITSGRSEQWQWANETMATKKGDCEDGAILMANMMLKSGIPYWRIRLNGGDVKGGGHAYVTYLREKDNKFYVLDWCYWPNESINFGQPWADAKNYFGIWFSWNKKYGFIKDTLDR